MLEYLYSKEFALRRLTEFIEYLFNLEERYINNEISFDRYQELCNSCWALKEIWETHLQELYEKEAIGNSN